MTMSTQIPSPPKAPLPGPVKIIAVLLGLAVVGILGLIALFIAIYAFMTPDRAPPPGPRPPSPTEAR